MVSSPSHRPLLFLDVDGPLIPFGAASYPSYGDDLAPDAHPLLTRLDPAHGRRLAALPCELVWATTWMGDANESSRPASASRRSPSWTGPSRLKPTSRTNATDC